MINYHTIKEIFADNSENSHFFQYLADSMPWGTNVPPTILMHAYAGVYSGRRIASPFLMDFVERGTDDTERDIIIATMLKSLFATKWKHLYSLTEISYNPIENYNMVEKSSTSSKGNESETTTDGNTRTLDTTDKRTDDLTDKTTGNVSRETSTTASDTAQVYGFNSGTGKPSDSSSATGSGTDTSNTTQTETQTGTQTQTQTGTITDAGTGSRTNESTGSSESTLERSGNIGVTTTQQMMEQELNLWNNFNFFETVFKDINSVLTISVY